jgi:NAD(P)-dependent dehydrogenase (short-subunit alcohol dehydrogenase family)
MTSELTGKTVLVTGSTDGLGRALALELAAGGATVLLHGRDPVRGEKTVRDIRDATGSDRLTFYVADLSSLSEVRGLAEQVLDEHDRLDVLVNNAGIGRGDGTREVSEDGYELRLAVMYLAPYLLTELLEPLLVESAPTRIVNVASAGQAPIDFDDLMLEREYDGIQAYCRSKLALVMLTLDQAEALRARDVTANCLHPGTFMPTKVVLEAGIRPVDSLENGVEATTRLVSAPELADVTGIYFDRTREARALEQAYDREARRRLDEIATRLVSGVKLATGG